MRIVKIISCNECPFFKRVAYLSNQLNLCSESPKLIFKIQNDIYKEVHEDCPLEEVFSVKFEE